MDELFSVRDKVVLITGSTRGIGFSLAGGFAVRGAVVVINGRTPAGVEKAVADLRQVGSRVYGYAFDVTKAEEVRANITRIEREVGPIEVLINNVGIHRRAPLLEMSLADWREVIEADLTSAFVVAQAVASYMIPRRRGRIINITSLNAEMARPSIGNYCAAKGGLKMLTKAMATEWGPYNINVNALGPGYFLTDLTKPLQENPEFDAWVRREAPLGRWGRPEELVGAAIFLASEAASFVNGQTIYVDGGWQAGL
ncbi:MAG: SDR family oxidoreductase [Bacillota bacterium]